MTGGIHGEDLTRDRNIRPSSICEPWAFATMHGYSVYSEFARDRTDPDVVPFLAALTASHERKAGALQRVRQPDVSAGQARLDASAARRAAAPRSAARDYACLSEDEMATYARAVLDRLHAAGAARRLLVVLGRLRTTTCARRRPFDRAPHELTFGIVRADGTTKPVAAALSAFAREARSVVEPHDPAIFEPAYYAGSAAYDPRRLRAISGVPSLKTILITGASSGIGRALAVQAARAGYAVYAVGRNVRALAALRRKSAKRAARSRPTSPTSAIRPTRRA